MTSAYALTEASETKWTILNGAMKGSVKLINLPSFTIGRSPECQIVINQDPKCSRKHAEVEWTDHGCVISSLNETNLIEVNGNEVQRASLADGDVIIVGETQIQFNVTSSQQLPNLEIDMGQTQIAVPPPPGQVQYAPSYPQQPARSKPQSQSRRNKKPQGNRLIFYGLIALVLVFFLLPNGKKKKDELALRTEQQIQADIDAANKLRDSALANRKTNPSITVQQAQENYVRGFRDYRKGQYERSLESFQACLALNPEHPLCNRYVRLAQRKFTELIQYNMVLGRKYRDQDQYQACRSAFRNVMVMVKDANNPTYREAHANYDACNALVEGRF